MSVLVMNCITNWMRESSSATVFEATFEAFRDFVQVATASIPASGELQKVYFQYQYDCRGMPKAVSGMRIGRYSKKHNHIEIYAEVTPAQFEADGGGRALLQRQLIDGLSQAEQRLAEKVTNNIGSLIQTLS